MFKKKLGSHPLKTNADNCEIEHKTFIILVWGALPPYVTKSGVHTLKIKLSEVQNLSERRHFFAPSLMIQLFNVKFRVSGYKKKAEIKQKCRFCYNFR